MSAALAVIAGHQAVAVQDHPLKDVWRAVLPVGLSIAELLILIPGLPADFERHGTVRVDGVAVERFSSWNGKTVDQWRCIRPKLNGRGRARVTFHMRLAGKGLRNIATIIASIALVAATTWISAGGIPALLGAGALGGLFTTSSTSALLLATAVGVLGRFALTALAQPAGKDKDNAAADLGNAGADGNVLQPGGPLPRVCGTTKIYPPLAAMPLVDLAGDDEFVEAAYILAGPHEMNNPRVENARFEDVDGLQFVLDDGLTSAPPHLLNRYGRQHTVQFEMKAHERDLDTVYKLKRQDSPESCLPEYRTEVSGTDPDEIWIHLIWPQGMGKQDGVTPACMPLKLRMRRLGTKAWKVLPELHFKHKKVGAIRKFIKLQWGDPGTISDSPEQYGAFHSFHSNASGQFAEPSFVGGAAPNNTDRVARAYDGFTVWLDEGAFPRGYKWEVQIKRGCLYKPGDFNPGAYSYSSGSAAFFDYQTASGQHNVPTGSFYDETILETCTLTRFASVWNSPPLPSPGNAKIELRAKNIQAQRVSVLAGGLIPLWDGNEWSGLGVSDNPADHYRNVLAGNLTRDPAEPDEIDEDSILAFRTHCTDRNYRIAAAFDGRSWRDTLSAIAACGKGQRKEGSRWGVVWERSRSADTPRQTLSTRVVNNVTLTKSFEEAPHGIRVTYRSKAKDYEPDEMLVIRPGLAREDATEIVTADAVGVVDPAQIEDLFSLDLALAYARDHIVECDAELHGLAAERGDLVSLNHIVLSRHHRAARLASVERDGNGDVVAVTLDARKALTAAGNIQDVADISDVAEITDVGQVMGCVIRTGANETVTALLANAAGDTARLVFANPIGSPPMQAGNPVVIGPAADVTERFLVQDVTPSRRFTARLTLLPEAQEVFS